MKVPYNYLPYEFQNPNPIFTDWKKLIKSSDFTLGRYMEKFEVEFKKYIGSKYCIATNNGTDALILSLKSLGIKTGDEVITVSNTFYATVGAIVAVGATPILCDCDDRYQIDPVDLEKKITKKTKVIIPVHWGGASPVMDKIIKVSKKYKLQIIEDACMGIGGKVNGISPGKFGKVSAFSMHPLKSLNVMGDGGAVVTDNKNIYKWLLKYRNHGMINRDNISIWGVNCRMQPLQSIVAMHGLKKLDAVINKRTTNASYLDEQLSPLKKYIKIPKRPINYQETYALYMILCKKRDDLSKYLIRNGIEVKIHYPKPLHLQKAYINSYGRVSLPVSEQQSKELLTLPVHQFLSKKQLNYMVNKIKEFYSYL